LGAGFRQRNGAEVRTRIPELGALFIDQIRSPRKTHWRVGYNSPLDGHGHCETVGPMTSFALRPVHFS
jgi:hypothetical protein